MKSRFSSAVLTAILLAATTSAFAQCKEFKWPENKAKADECVAVYGDAMKQGNYRGATACWQWMANAAPQWNTKLYIDGADIYDKLAEQQTDPAKKKVLVDSLLMIYDLRIKNCGDEANVMNRKAYASYKYNIKNKEKLADLLALYDKVFEMNGAKVSDGNLVAYLTTVKANQIAFKNITDEQILQRYDKIMTIVDEKIADATRKGKTDDVNKLKGYKEAVDGLLIGMVKVDCEFVKKNLAPKFKQNPNDLALAKKIFTFMLQDKCTEDPLFLEAAEAIHKLNPEKDWGIVKIIVARYINSGHSDKAKVMIKESMPLAKTGEQKAEANLMLGSIEAKEGNYSTARSLFLQAGTNEAYEKIGDLYYNSFDNCAKKVSVAQDRLVYIAAYEMYQKAGNNQLMSRAKAQFPSKEEIFLLNWPAGSNQKIECWIGESVVLKTRD